LYAIKTKSTTIRWQVSQPASAGYGSGMSEPRLPGWPLCGEIPKFGYISSWLAVRFLGWPFFEGRLAKNFFFWPFLTMCLYFKAKLLTTTPLKVSSPMCAIRPVQ